MARLGGTGRLIVVEADGVVYCFSRSGDGSIRVLNMSLQQHEDTLTICRRVNESKRLGVSERDTFIHAVIEALVLREKCEWRDQPVSCSADRGTSS